MPTIQDKRDLIAKMKLIPVHELINGQRLLLIDDSIVRGTQLRETTEFLYHSGAKEVHVRPACPPLLFGCKYLNFSRSTGEMELITRRMIRDAEGENVSREVLTDYANPDSERYQAMLDVIMQAAELLQPSAITASTTSSSLSASTAISSVLTAGTVGSKDFETNEKHCSLGTVLFLCPKHDSSPKS